MSFNGSLAAWRRAWPRVRSLAFLLVPLVALWETVAHMVIVWSVPRSEDWRQARKFIARERRPGDLVASAPWWTDPLARNYFSGLIPMRDAARPDATRYSRALVATIRGGVHPDFAGWREETTQTFGGVKVRVLRNPHVARVLYDFIEQLGPQNARVIRSGPGGDRTCTWQSGLHVEGGGLGQGALPGPERFVCGDPWNYVGRTVIEDMDHRGRWCIWSHPVAGASMLTTFHNVPMGTVVRGYHGLAYEAERGGDHYETGAPVTLTVRAGEQILGQDVHVDGDGWKLFTFDTRALAGSHGEVTFEVTALEGGNRHYCFQADTR